MTKASENKNNATQDITKTKQDRHNMTKARQDMAKTNKTRQDKTRLTLEFHSQDFQGQVPQRDCQAFIHKSKKKTS